MSINPGELVGQALALAGELASTSKRNGELLISTVRDEARKASATLGLARRHELTELADQVAQLSVEVDELRITNAHLRSENGQSADAQPSEGCGCGGAGCGADTVAPESSSPVGSSDSARPTKRKIYLEEQDV